MVSGHCTVAAVPAAAANQFERRRLHLVAWRALRCACASLSSGAMRAAPAFFRLSALSVWVVVAPQHRECRMSAGRVAPAACAPAVFVWRSQVCISCWMDTSGSCWWCCLEQRNSVGLTVVVVSLLMKRGMWARRCSRSVWCVGCCCEEASISDDSCERSALQFWGCQRGVQRG